MPTEKERWREQWEDALTKLNTLRHPRVDRTVCGWNEDTRLTLAERFIEEHFLGGLYEKYLDRIASDELKEADDED